MDKAVWDDATTETFVYACVEQIYKKERQGSHFTRDGWKAIVATFNEKTGNEYTRAQLKNRFDILRKDFKAWESLIRETGASRDPTGKVVASKEWWQRKIQENSAYRKFRHTGLKFETELRIIFKDAMANGEDVIGAPFPNPQAQVEDAENEDVYRPAMHEEEGSGDSEDDLFGANPVPSTGVTDELASIGLPTSTPSTTGTASGSRGKRKVGEGSGQRKKQKGAASKQIADAVSVMAFASKDRAATLDAMKEVSVNAAVTQLFRIDELIQDEDFRHRCIDLVQDRTNRETFVSICQENMAFVVPWLRYKIYGS